MPYVDRISLLPPVPAPATGGARPRVAILVAATALITGLGTSPAAATTTPTVLKAAEPPPGSLFVANEGAHGDGNGGSGPGSITAYRPGASGNAGPEVVITKGIDEPSDLAFDASGDLWVTNNGKAADDDYSVVEYTKAALASASPTPAVSAYFWASGLAFDSSGNLWLTSTTDVEEFGTAELPRSGHYLPDPKVEIVPSLDDAVCAPAFNHAGDMWSAGYGDTGDYTTLVEFTKAQLAKSGEPTAKVVITSNDLDYSCQPAFDAAGNLWISNPVVYGVGAVVEFTKAQLVGSGTQFASTAIASMSYTGPGLIAFTSSGDMWVPFDSGANLGDWAVSEFSKAQLAHSGTKTPAVTITGSHTRLNSPTAVALEP